ncbi:hypothetical protein ACGFW5_30990 [Streptomyces sp. NPDC048416]|uniref:hypothetical protein n=1 Tax=Streptomyces sp. NPDC048416 TaxID=3365546 RepID=UPI0037178C86
MSNVEQGRASGSVPHAFGNAIAWRWSREMPASLKRSGMLTLLYALRAMANASGELKFHGDHKPIRIQDIAKAAGADEKDTRERMEAAILAGVVMVKGERRRGRASLYVVMVTPWPDWSAAAAFLDAAKARREAAKKGRADRRPAPWAEEKPGEKFGGRSPELDGPEFGGPPPELTDGTAEEVRGTAPRLSSGDRPPNGSGDRPPNNPGTTHVITQERAEVVPQPQVDEPPGPHKITNSHEQDHPAQPPELDRCRRCWGVMIPDPQRPGRTTHAHCAERTSS